MKSNQERQSTFADWTLAQRTICNRTLEAINKLVDFAEAEQCLEATYSSTGRPAHRTSLMLRILILQHLYNLSDPQAEECVADRLSFQKFVGLGSEEQVPDETSICRFRQRMIHAQLHEKLLHLLNSQLEKAGYLVKRTVVVDATLIESSRTRADRVEVDQGRAPDPDARYAKKRGKSYYGYKAHLCTDGDTQLICQAQITSANVDDSRVFAQLLENLPDTRAVYADKAYDSKANKQYLFKNAMANGILKKGAKHIKLTCADRKRNSRKSRTRRPIERVFGHMKKWQNYTRVRYLGKIKNQLELTLKAVTYNLMRLVNLADAATAS